MYGILGYSCIMVLHFHDSTQTILSIKEAREALLDFLGIAVPTSVPTSATKNHQTTVLSYNAGCHVDTSVLTEVTEENDGGTCVDTTLVTLTGDGDGGAHVDGGPLEDVTIRRHRQKSFVTSDNVVAGVLLALGHQCTCCHTMTHTRHN